MFMNTAWTKHNPSELMCAAFLNRVCFYVLSDFIYVVCCPQVNCSVRLYRTVFL